MTNSLKRPQIGPRVCVVASITVNQQCRTWVRYGFDKRYHGF